MRRIASSLKNHLWTDFLPALGAGCRLFRVLLIVYVCIVSTPVRGAEPASEQDRYWPQWRGPQATGVAPYGDPPVEWSEFKNVRCKIEIPGKGRASPIVWGDRVFVSTAIPTGQQVETQESGEDTLNGQRIVRPVEIQSFTFFAIERKSGAIVWQRTVRRELPHEGTHIDGSWASGSPVTDGERVYAYFGSRGLVLL